MSSNEKAIKGPLFCLETGVQLTCLWQPEVSLRAVSRRMA